MGKRTRKKGSAAYLGLAGGSTAGHRHAGRAPRRQLPGAMWDERVDVVQTTGAPLSADGSRLSCTAAQPLDGGALARGRRCTRGEWACGSAGHLPPPPWAATALRLPSVQC